MPHSRSPPHGPRKQKVASEGQATGWSSLKRSASRNSDTVLKTPFSGKLQQRGWGGGVDGVLRCTGEPPTTGGGGGISGVQNFGSPKFWETVDAKSAVTREKGNISCGFAYTCHKPIHGPAMRRHIVHAPQSCEYEQPRNPHPFGCSFPFAPTARAGTRVSRA